MLKITKNSCILYAITSLFVLVFFSTTSLSQSLDELIDNGGYILADADGKQVMGLNEKVSFTPASTVKIVTSLAALDILGADYRFTTSFYYDSDKNLYIVGGGDPFLVSEEIDLISLLLRTYGLFEINSVIVDNSLYRLDSPADGIEKSLNPYDAHNSALAVNFNTVHIKVHKDKTVVSAEEQTPTVSFLQRFSFLPPGKHRININQLATKSISPTLQYAGELFLASLKKKGIIVRSDSIIEGSPPDDLQPLMEWPSRFSLDEIVAKYLHSSNNFMTNQIFLQLGLKAKGAPATWQKSRKTIAEYLAKEHNLTAEVIHMEEGSGLSRKTFMTPETMIQLLYTFMPHYQLLSFSKEYQLHRKTGSLKGVYCLAGYIPQGKDLFPFTIFLNQKKNNRYKVLGELIKASENY